MTTAPAHGEPIPELTDDFAGPALDPAKWLNPDPGWQGRYPGFFAPHNVAVRNGCLELTARAETLPDLPPGYHTFTTASVLSRATVRYGYFEIKARPMRSHASSAFWFYRNTPEAWTELDVFEISAGAPERERKVYCNAHVFHTPTITEHEAWGAVFDTAADLADDFHLFALDWRPDHIRWFVDGALAHELPNDHWHYPLNLAFDSETFPDWFGLPDPAELPATFSIAWVRAFRPAPGVVSEPQS